MIYVISCGEEGVQLNEGTRLGIVGSGVSLKGADTVISYLKQMFDTVYIAASEENAWIRAAFQLNTWEQANATYQQQAAVIADRNQVGYAGIFEFSDPKALSSEIKGHMVRPQKIHIANSISLTIGGGEQTYHLGHFVISADWVHLSDPTFVKEFLTEQIEHYKSLVNMKDIKITIEEAGTLDPEIIQKNKDILAKAGFSS